MIKDKKLKQQQLYMDLSCYDWVFHYNAYSSTWTGFHRDDYFAYWNGSESKHAIIRSSKIETVQEIIKKTNGDKKLLDELTRRTGEK
jgi:hypothetical protein